MAVWNKKRQLLGEGVRDRKIKQGRWTRASGLLSVSTENSSRSFLEVTDFSFFFLPLLEAAAHIWQHDPQATTICKDTRFYDLLSVRFMEMIYDQQFFIFSSQEQTWRVTDSSLHGRVGLWDPSAGPQTKSGGPMIRAGAMHLIKMGYSGAILRYVNECYIIDIY